MEKLVITAALLGALTMREQNPHVPYAPEEIARAAIDACKAGASMVHLHVRNPETGTCVQEAHLFKEVIEMIKRECDDRRGAGHVDRRKNCHRPPPFSRTGFQTSHGVAELRFS